MSGVIIPRPEPVESGTFYDLLADVNKKVGAQNVDGPKFGQFISFRADEMPIIIDVLQIPSEYSPAFYLHREPSMDTDDPVLRDHHRRMREIEERLADEPEPTEVIKRSHGLLVVAGIHKDPAVVDIAHHILGIPYAKEKQFVISEAEDETTIAYIKEVSEVLKALRLEKGGGCPAGMVTSPSQPDTRVLNEYWEELVDFLVPPDATATGK